MKRRGACKTCGIGVLKPHPPAWLVCDNCGEGYLHAKDAEKLDQYRCRDCDPSFGCWTRAQDPRNIRCEKSPYPPCRNCNGPVTYTSDGPECEVCEMGEGIAY